MSMESTEEISKSLQKLNLEEQEVNEHGTQGSHVQESNEERRSQRRKVMTTKGQQYELQKLEEKRISLERRIKRKIQSIEDLMYTRDNEATIREEMSQLNDLIVMMYDILGGGLELDGCDGAYDLFDEDMCAFKRKVHNWLRSVAEEKEEERSSRCSRKSRTSAKTKSTSSSRTSRSSRSCKLEAKMKLAELEAQAEFLKAKAAMKIKTEELEIQEQIAMARAKMNVMEMESEDAQERASINTRRRTSLLHQHDVTQRSMEWQDDANDYTGRQGVVTYRSEQAADNDDNIHAEVNDKLQQSWSTKDLSRNETYGVSNNNANSPACRNTHEKGVHRIDEALQEDVSTCTYNQPKYRRAKLLDNDEQMFDNNKRRNMSRSGQLGDHETMQQVSNIKHLEQDKKSNSNFDADNNISKQLCHLLKQQSAPDIEMEMFHGNPIDFQYFITMFHEVVEIKVDDQVGKLMRLLKFTEGEPKELIKHCVHQSPQNCYDIAKDLLIKQYGNKHRILAAYREEINTLTLVKANDSKALRKLFTFLLKVQGLKIDDGKNPLNNADTICKILSKLPTYLQDRWGRNVHTMRKKKSKEPNLHDLIELIEDEMMMVDDPLFSRGALNKQAEKEKVDSRRRYDKTKIFFSGQQEPKDEIPDGQKVWREWKCAFCDEKHETEKCREYLALSMKERCSKIFKKRLCYKCLKHINHHHTAATCKYPKKCMVCNENHPTTLHGMERTNLKEDTNDAKKDSKEITMNKEKAVVINALANSNVEVVSLCIVPVEAKNQNNGSIWKTYAMLDSCSQGSFISNKLQQKLSLHGYNTSLLLKTINGERTQDVVTVTGIQVKGIEDVDWLTIPKLYCQEEIPVTHEDFASYDQIKKWSYLAKVLDKMKHSNEVQVDLLIGANCPQALEPHEHIKSQDGGPYAVRTLLGWCVVGPIMKADGNRNTNRIGVHKINCRETKEHHFECKKIIKEVDISNLIRKMYNEDFPENQINCYKDGLSVEDRAFMKIVEEGTVLANGKYEVPLPLRNKHVIMPNNRSQAYRRFLNLQRKFEKNAVFKDLYMKAMNEMFTKGYAELASENRNSWYIPHQGVTHPAKPNKVRIVFDASAEHFGKCINKELLKGPDLTNQLVGVLLRFREEEVAVTADIEGMFFQVKIPLQQRCFFKFLWFQDNNPDLGIQDFQMTSHIFGGTSSPSCANFALRKTADDNKGEYDENVWQALLRNFYVDDLVKSLSSKEFARKFVVYVKDLCKKGGFNLTKFCSNDEDVLINIPKEDRKIRKSEENLLNNISEESILGMKWSPTTDTLQFKLNKEMKPLTKRGILSTISSVYDPLGLVGPFVLEGRRILQKICKVSNDWDAPVPEDIKNEWILWRKNLDKIEEITTTRCIKPKNFGRVRKRILNIFSDASESGYGVACYLKQVNEDGKIHVNLIYGRSRVAPLKYVSIPRLELTAALLAAKSTQMIINELDQNIDEIKYWTDSRVVLGYISNVSRNFKIFVANRVQQIQELSDVTSWRYVSSKQNPADHASRGLNPEQSQKSRQWFSGPDFLWDETFVDNDDVEFNIEEDDKELKRRVVVNQIIEDESLLGRLTRITNNWLKLVKIMVFIIRFINNSRSKQVSKYSKQSFHITVAEKKIAVKEILKLLQQEKLTIEMKQLKSKGEVQNSSKIIKLNPFLKDDLICVGGRLSKSSLPENQKFPIIIPNKHEISKMIINHYHQKVAHSGRNCTANKIRGEGYWIINGSSLIRKVIMDCVTCHKLFRSCEDQKMGDLPKERTDICPPFTNVGVDIFGPFFIKERGSVLKRYGVMFTCLNLRAVHIEVVNTMTTDSFILSLRRMVGRRGNVKLIRSDNGTNFVGADNELTKALDEMNKNKIREFLWTNDIEWVVWKRNPPAASHMGGVWERQIRTARRILTSLMDSHKEKLNEESFRTLMIEVEAIINSRPLTTDSLNDEDTMPLSPTQLLTLKSDVVFPPPGSFDSPADLYSRKQWRRVQSVANEFWHRWRKEFLQNLQTRSKWNSVKRSLNIGDVVLLNDGSSRSCWPLGRVVTVFKDHHDIVRTVDLKVYDRKNKTTSLIRRPISKLVLLVANEIDSPTEEPCQDLHLEGSQM